MEGVRLHTGAWLTWVVAGFAVLAVTRNPWYVGLALLWIGIVRFTLRADQHAVRGAILSPWRFALIVVPVAALLNALFVHAGTTVLFRISAVIPVLGGPVTLEAMVYGALNGLVLTGLFAAFAVFNQVTPLREIVRLTPSAYYPVAVTLAVALTFVPVTLRHAEAIREAQAVRGFRLRGLRGWFPLFLPLLSGGLERAMLLSEAMVARGFASAPRRDGRSPLATQALLVLGILLFAAGWILRQFSGSTVAGTVIMLCGIFPLAAALLLAGRQNRHTVYRPAAWRARDWLVAAMAGVTALIFLLPLPGVDRTTLAWNPYPTLHMPGISLVLAAATWGLLGPALVNLYEAS